MVSSFLARLREGKGLTPAILAQAHVHYLGSIAGDVGVVVEVPAQCPLGSDDSDSRLQPNSHAHD